MREWNRTVPFLTDERGVSEVVGAVLLFGILILALTTYQATIVPQQNAQTEFQHFEEVRNELIELRNAVSTAGQADVSQFPSITLGTTYQTRLFTINPPAPAGTLQTSESYNITISNGTEEYDKNISTRFLDYQPGYHEITVGPTRYEHSVLYLDERERGNGISITEDQNIVKDGTVRITALQNEFQETGTRRVTLELYPQDKLRADDFPDPNGANLTVLVPTRLTESNYWDEALVDASGIYQGVDSGSEVDKLNLSVNSSDLKINTVGVRKEPNEDPAKSTQPQSTGDSGGGAGSVTDDGSLSFDGLPTATSNNDNNAVSVVDFNFDISNPDGINYQIVLGVQNQIGDTSNVGPLTTPTSPKSVTESDGDALPNAQMNQGSNYLDVEIILRNADGSVVDTRSGRINSKGETVTLS